MRRRMQHNAFVIFTDLTTCLFMWAIMCAALLIISVHVQATNKQDTHPKAEYLVTLTWDDDRDVDLDLWLRDPSDHTISYITRELPNISLDRDSRGSISNRTFLPDGRVIDSGNQEIIAIRAIVPGTYTVAVNYYGKGDGGYDSAAIDCVVEVAKVNPVMQTVLHAKLHLNAIKEYHSVFTFHIDDDGRVTQLPLSQDNLMMPGN